MTRLLLTGSVPLWCVALVFIVLCASTIVVYRRQRLPRPMSWVLPTLRIVAFLLVLLALIRPVLATFTSRIERGRIAVVVDNSGSMSVRDEYSKAEQVDIGWAMQGYSRDLRNRVFTDLDQEFSAVAEALSAMQTSVHTLGETGRAHPLADGHTKAAVKALGRSVERMQDLEKAVAASVEKTSYLEGDASATNAFSGHYDRWHTRLTDTVAALQDHGEALKQFHESGSLSNAAAYARTELESIAGVDQKRVGIEASFRDLQVLADAALADAGIAAVDSALAQVRATSRWDLVNSVLRPGPVGLLDQLEQKGPVEVFLLDDEKVEVVPPDALGAERPERASTRLGAAAHAILQHYENDPVAAVVVITDGNNNAGQSLEAVHALAGERGIPVLAVGVGAQRPPHDVAVESVIAPRTSFKGDQVRARVVLRRYGFTDKALNLKIISDGDIKRTLVIPPGPDERLPIDASFAEDREGKQDYVVEVSHDPDEVLEVNNTRAFEVSILEDRIRTLFIDEFPRWESRYLRMMLKRDKRVDLKTIFVASLNDGVLTAGKERYPEDRNALFAHQIVILGDVNPEHLSREQLQDLRDFVLERGGTLIAMAGEHYMPHHYAGTPLSDVLPFADLHERGVAPRREPGPGGSVDVPLALTDSGKHDTLVQIGSTPEISARLWKELPGVNWVRPDASAPPASDVMVQEDAASLPVMMKSFSGAGKVLFLGADSFWRWRDRARWRYHHRFWGQVVLWGALGRTTGSDKYVKMMADRLTYSPGESIQLRLRILDEDGNPISAAQGTIAVQDEQQDVIKSAPLFDVQGADGEYRAELNGLTRGHYTAVPKIFELEGKDVTASIEFDVGDVAAGEYVHLALNDAAMKSGSDAYRPVHMPLDLLESIEPIEEREDLRSDYELWDNVWFLLLGVMVLGAEWTLRKRNRLA